MLHFSIPPHSSSSGRPHRAPPGTLPPRCCAGIPVPAGRNGRREGDGSLDLDEEKRSRHRRALRFEFHVTPLRPSPQWLLEQAAPRTSWHSATTRVRVNAGMSMLEHTVWNQCPKHAQVTSGISNCYFAPAGSLAPNTESEPGRSSLCPLLPPERDNYRKQH